MLEELKALWETERCAFCGEFGLCRHRHVEMDAARLEGMRLRMLRLDRQRERRADYLRQVGRKEPDQGVA